MSIKVSITLDDEILHFVDERTANRSRFINEILQREKQRIFLEELAAAYQAQAVDTDLQAEVGVWNTTLSDGLADDA